MKKIFLITFSVVLFFVTSCGNDNTPSSNKAQSNQLSGFNNLIEEFNVIDQRRDLLLRQLKDELASLEDELASIEQPLDDFLKQEKFQKIENMLNTIKSLYDEQNKIIETVKTKYPDLYASNAHNQNKFNKFQRIIYPDFISLYDSFFQENTN